MDIAEIIKSRRSFLQISQLDLAEMAEVSLATVKDLERGKGNPSLKTLEKLGEVLGLELQLVIRHTNIKL